MTGKDDDLVVQIQMQMRCRSVRWIGILEDSQVNERGSTM